MSGTYFRRILATTAALLAGGSGATTVRNDDCPYQDPSNWGVSSHANPKMTSHDDWQDFATNGSDNAWAGTPATPPKG